MEEMTFTKEGVILREAVVSFGETNMEEKTVPYDELGSVEADFDTGGFIPLENLFDVKMNDSGNGVESIRLQIGDGFLSEAAVRPRDSGENTDRVPPVPHVGADEFQYNGRRKFYQRMKEKPDSQPATIRRIMYSERDLTRRDLDQLIEEEGYQASSGGTSQSLVVLEKVTGEIERHGRGEDQRIVWSGED